jgi:hypothetical protein
VNPNFVTVSYIIPEPVTDTLGSSSYNNVAGMTGMGGIMFDVVATNKDLSVTKLGFQFNGGYGSSNPYEVYMLTSLGIHTPSNMFQPSLWTLLASGDVLSEDPGTFTASFVADIPAGQIRAFYIRGVSRGIVSQKSEASGDGYGYAYKSDSNMELMAGRGLSSSGGAFSHGYGIDYYVNPNFVTVSYEYFE